MVVGVADGEAVRDGVREGVGVCDGVALAVADVVGVGRTHVGWPSLATNKPAGPDAEPAINAAEDSTPGPTTIVTVRAWVRDTPPTTTS